MNKKKITDILNKILVGLEGNYKISNNCLIKSPIKDIIVGFCFENSSSENMMYIWWFAQPLFVPSDTMNLTFGNRINLGEGGQLWDFSQSKTENNIKILSREMQLIEIKEINTLETPLNFYHNYYKNKEKNLRIYEAIVISASWVDLPNMDNEIENCLLFVDKNLDKTIPWIKQVVENLNLLKEKKTKEDKHTLLDRWKNETIANLKLD
jgi:hypothetical protein